MSGLLPAFDILAGSSVAPFPTLDPSSSRQTCIALNATCPGSNLALAPTTKTASPAACPTGCYNPSGSSGYPRRCNTVAPDMSTPLRACGHYAYVQQFIKNSAPSVRVLISVGGWYDSK